MTDLVTAFVVSVIASITAYYICKWLDRELPLPVFCFWCTIQTGYTAALLCFYYTLIKNKSKPFYSSSNNLL